MPLYTWNGVHDFLPEIHVIFLPMTFYPRENRNALPNTEDFSKLLPEYGFHSTFIDIYNLSAAEFHSFPQSTRQTWYKNEEKEKYIHYLWKAVCTVQK